MTVHFAGIDTPTEPLGVGTWAWGDSATWGMGSYDTTVDESTIAAAWESSIDAGVTLFDTAEVYGDGESERIIGRLLEADPARRAGLVIATKFMPMPWKVNLTSAMRSAVLASIDRLGIERVDLYQVHGPISLRSHAAMAEALATLHRDGLVAAVGVSNYSEREMRSIHGELARAAWRSHRTRSSTRCCDGARSRRACSPSAPSWAWCRSRTRRSGRVA